MPQVLLNDGSTFSHPESWKCEIVDGFAKLEGPESDFIVYF